MDPSEVTQFVAKYLNIQKFATQNRCMDVTCIFQKLMFHKVFRVWNQWQSFLLHRYFSLFQDESTSITFQHIHMKNVGTDVTKWVYSRAEVNPFHWRSSPTDISKHIQQEALGMTSRAESSMETNPSHTNVFLVEMWQGRKHSLGNGGPSMFHNLVIIQNQSKMVCIPFDEQAFTWAHDAPLEKLFHQVPGSMQKKVHPHDFPFLPLLWFHVAVLEHKDIVKSVEQDFKEKSGMAFFEMHLVDALVAVQEPMEQLKAFADERIAFAHNHMTPYRVLG